MRAIPLITIFCGSVAFGQLQSNSVTVTASTSAAPQPDQAVFDVIVDSDLNSTLSTILTAVQPAGLTIANFSGVSSESTIPARGLTTTVLQWEFSLAVPLTNTPSTVTALTSLAASVSKANGNLSVTFSIIGTQVSQQLQQSQPCDIPGLINQARTQAQNLAGAANRSVGGVLSLSGTASGPSSTSYSVNTFASSGPQNCSLTVTFSLLGV